MLVAERDADDRHEIGQGEKQVTQRQPEAGENKPDDIADQAQAAGTDVFFTGDILAVDRLATEGPDREPAAESGSQGESRSPLHLCRSWR